MALADDPIGALEDSVRRAPQPGLIAREAVMLGEVPENPAVMLIVTSGLIAARAVKDAVFAREIARQTDGALEMEPAIETILRFLLVAAAVQLHDHHAGFVAIRAVSKEIGRASCRERV